jgi:hypothetical protein
MPPFEFKGNEKRPSSYTRLLKKPLFPYFKKTLLARRIRSFGGEGENDSEKAGERMWGRLKLL